jgi:hypothetical protein
VAFDVQRSMIYGSLGPMSTLLVVNPEPPIQRKPKPGRFAQIQRPEGAPIIDAAILCQSETTSAETGINLLCTSRRRAIALFCAHEKARIDAGPARDQRRRGFGQ